MTKIIDIAMTNIFDLPTKMFFVLKLIFNQVKTINELIIKSDDENLEKLLERPEDKVKFQKAIDEVMKDSISKDVTLNGKNITISI
ncbi:hypothetical protein [Flavobacterium fluviatile]|uniref:hypothetical protein n=1 Tax=Flavobacterium fluviatile TaxID=1862387 RepID=UPI0013D2CE35|nr:hypothetical protein [Flavobacterium fluviatile]